jgi:hypothetical protein
MQTYTRTLLGTVAAMFIAFASVSRVAAWNPPSGNAKDQAIAPASPTTPLRQAHGYITQNAISLLENDGYWFAAGTLREWQQELLNGVRYADVKDGTQHVVVQACAQVPVVGWIFDSELWCGDVNVKTITAGKLRSSWPLAANEHYFNPESGTGLDQRGFSLVDALEDFVQALGFVKIKITVDPPLQPRYRSALDKFSEEYSNAVNAYRGVNVPSVKDATYTRESKALAMFYLGWASHLMQDLTVVHHTFDTGLNNHSEYEDAADGMYTSPPVADGVKHGMYDVQGPSPGLSCPLSGPVCYPWTAAVLSHDGNILDDADDGIYANVKVAIPLAQSLQAGLYAAFLTDIGQPPIHMSAVMAMM